MRERRGSGTIAGRMALVALLVAPAGVALAAEHTLPTRLFLVRSPGAIGDPATRKVTFAQEQEKSLAEIVGDPTIGGATIWMSLADGTSQCFDLPAFAWSAVGMLGFKYHNLAGPGAVTSAAIDKEEFTGDLILKWKLRGSTGPIDLAPVPGNSGFAVVFQINGGDTYCAGGATPASGSTATSTAYRVKNVPPPSACGVPACSPAGAFADPATP